MDLEDSRLGAATLSVAVPLLIAGSLLVSALSFHGRLKPPCPKPPLEILDKASRFGPVDFRLHSPSVWSTVPEEGFQRTGLEFRSLEP